ncbi:MAG: DEAD/DEAH box helicase [Rhodobacter sp.]|nr:DEAD/DEAH box helicase [Rhodobacter sp.]
MKKALQDALDTRGYTTLTPVQEAVLKPELIGADLLVSAQTGSGKTLGFGLAIAPVLLDEQEVFGAADLPLALVVAPTRELALQVKRELGWLYAPAGAVVTSCVGGMDMRDERRALGRGAHIVVATPGRLRDHIMRGSIKLGDLRAIVLDEADEMLDLGFREDLEFILGEAPETRQTLMFSATVPASIATLAKKYQKDAVRVTTTTEHSQHADIEYRAMTVSGRDGENAIINVLRYYEAPNAIVFCNTRAMVGRLTSRLSNRGFSVVALSGELSQSERTHALQAMRDGRARVCVATDVAARGIDLPNLDLVVHAELPSNHETLLHRSGRTGRAGRKGVSTLIVDPKNRKKAERILKFAKLRAEWSAAPSADAVIERDQERMMADPAWFEAIADAEAGAVQQLIERFSAEQIAAAFLRLFNSRHTAPEELADADEKPQARPEFGPSVWFSVPGGRSQNAEPRRLLPMLCKAGGLSKDDFGAIRVQQDESFVEIREASVAGFLQAIGPDMRVEGNVTLTRLAAKPDTSAPPRAPYAARPKSEKPAAEKPSTHKAGIERPAADKAAEPAPVSPGTTKPVDWNDAPAPRVRKPKPGSKPARSKKPTRPDSAPVEAADAPTTPWRKPDGYRAQRTRNPGGKPGGKPDAEAKKGPPPPKGKPNSKKNKARSKFAGQSHGKPGGTTAPKRKRP